MGAQHAKPDEGSKWGHLTSDEVLSLKKLFNALNTQVVAVGPKSEKLQCCSYLDFQRHCEGYVDDWLAKRLTEKLSTRASKGEDHLIPVNSCLHLISNWLKGSHEEKVDVICALAASPNGPPPQELKSLTIQELRQYVQSIVESYLKNLESSSAYKSWSSAEIDKQQTPDSLRDFADFLLRELLWKILPLKQIITETQTSTSSKPPKEIANKDELETWYGSSSLLQQLHSSVISGCFRLDVESSGYSYNLLPSCTGAHPAFRPENYSLLDLSRILFLNSHLPHKLRSQWRFLYSTQVHGESFSKLLGQIQDKGSTLLIIREQKGERVFGAFCTNGWALGPKFFGGEESFLFHLSPQLVIYPATGYNKNFQYLNVQQQTLPNGLGIGGKLGFFGLWLDAEFGKGRCAPSCTTYQCPQLSSSEEFNINHLEVWGVGPPPEKDENERDPRSILDVDPEAKALLEMVNKGNHSDGYREEPHCND